MKIAIQGIEGCFHDAAAHEYMQAVNPDEVLTTVECNTFHDLFALLDTDVSTAGIVAIENTIAGPLLQNHELLRRSQLKIVGEHRMRISHVLCALPGQTIDDICEIHSHPMALMQCERFLHSIPGKKKIESFDTAGAARDIAAAKAFGHAAICGRYAAELYGLDILAEEIETNKRNFTRFLIVADPLIEESINLKSTPCNKASVVFTLPHTRGALSKVLTILSFYDINLSKIQSTPIIGREWEYRFYIDLTFEDYSRYYNAISAVRPLLNDFRTLGEYTER